MQSKLKLVNSNQVWDAKRRYKINETVTYNDINYQNATGTNSQPGITIDWVVVNLSFTTSYSQYDNMEIFYNVSNLQSKSIGDGGVFESKRCLYNEIINLNNI
jgi:hypothetical protein